MNKVKKIVGSLVLVLVAISSAVAGDFKCTQPDGCNVRLWDPGCSCWLTAEEVPNGTIVNSDWAMPWGEGWSSV